MGRCRRNSSVPGTHKQRDGRLCPSRNATGQQLHHNQRSKFVATEQEEKTGVVHTAVPSTTCSKKCSTKRRPCFFQPVFLCACPATTLELRIRTKRRFGCIIISQPTYPCFPSVSAVAICRANIGIFPRLLLRSRGRFALSSKACTRCRLLFCLLVQ